MLFRSGEEDFSAFEGAHASPHDLVDQEQVGGDHRARVHHLPLHPVVVVDALVLGNARLPCVAVHANARPISRLLEELDHHLLRVVTSVRSQRLGNDHQAVGVGLDAQPCLALDSLQELLEHCVTGNLERCG